MPQFQPSPMVVIRNQLLAFMVLNLLGSCVPISDVEAPKVLAERSCAASLSGVNLLRDNSCIRLQGR